MPVLGAHVRGAPALNLYATAGRGFETPTFNELAYRPSGRTGLNFASARPRAQREAGVKTRSDGGDVDVALFETRTSDEIAVASNAGGRSTFRNVGRAAARARDGAVRRLRENLRAQVAYTCLDARYRDTFLTCAGRPCPAPNLPIPAGNRIPGSRATRSTRARLGPPLGWRGGVEARALSKVWSTTRTPRAAGFATVNASAGYVARSAASTLTGFVRVDNLFDRRYAGSVIVNEGNGRYFEPAPTRN